MTKSEITIHFGKNPSRGGIPPIDSKFIAVRGFIKWGRDFDEFLLDEEERSCIINGSIIIDVIIEYRIR